MNNENEVRKTEEDVNSCNNDLITSFLNRLLTHYINREHDEIEKILIGKKNVNEERIYKYSPKNPDVPKYIDEDSIINVRVWTNEETKELLKILYYVCKDENNIVTLNNKMIELWLFETNTEMCKFFHKEKKIEISKLYRPIIKIKKNTYSEFTKRCELLGINGTQGFHMCINNFIEQKARTYD